MDGLRRSRAREAQRVCQTQWDAWRSGRGLALAKGSSRQACSGTRLVLGGATISARLDSPAECLPVCLARTKVPALAIPNSPILGEVFRLFPWTVGS